MEHRTAGSRSDPETESREKYVCGEGHDTADDGYTPTRSSPPRCWAKTESMRVYAAAVTEVARFTFPRRLLRFPVASVTCGAGDEHSRSIGHYIVFNPFQKPKNSPSHVFWNLIFKNHSEFSDPFTYDVQNWWSNCQPLFTWCYSVLFCSWYSLSTLSAVN